MSTNPYGKYVEGIDPVRSLEETSARIAELVTTWPASRFDQSHLAGKWSGRQLLIHLAQVEMVASVRLRFVLAEAAHTIHPFEQDDWMAFETAVTGPQAYAAYAALRAMNLALARSLPDSQRSKPATHPEFGPITVEWILQWLAGHERHHVPQFEAEGV